MCRMLASSVISLHDGLGLVDDVEQRRGLVGRTVVGRCTLISREDVDGPTGGN